MNVFKIFIELKCFFRLVFFLIYLLTGAVIFLKLEQNDEPNAVVAKRILAATRSRLSLRIGVNISDEDFFDALKDISRALKLRGKPDWTFWKASDFVFIALTTIGYGDIVPESEKAQGVFIIYALMGIPFAMVTLKYTGIFMSKLIHHLISRIEKRIFGRLEPTRLGLKCFIVSLIVFFVGHLMMGYGYSIIKNVSLVTGIYAIFVSMTTIGFGDYTVSFIDETASEEVIPLLFFVRVVLTLLTLTVVSCILNTPLEIEEVCSNTHSGQVKPNPNKRGEESEGKASREDGLTSPSCI